jgi:hypothetical protein
MTEHASEASEHGRADDLPEAFHEGERILQDQSGLAERLARLGPQVIRDHMPEQHRRFFALLPFVIVGSIDERRQPTASLLAEPPGFISSPDDRTLRIDALPREDDPLAGNLRRDGPLALLGIQPHTRRRNRANGRVIARDGHGFELMVRQSFGNCPKYIHAREAVYVGARESRRVVVTPALDERQRALIARADTFFIASAHPEAHESGARSHGVDVSHRGGAPGFVHFVGDDTFVIPDFRGNNFYNTLGNLVLNPAAGLLFIDVASGDLLQIDAHAQAVAGGHPLAGRDGTGRIVRFVVRGARWVPGASPLEFRELELTGD